MVIKFIDRFQEIKKDLLEQFSEKEPDSYEDIFIQTIKMMFDNNGYDVPDYERITVIDHGCYQGTQLFIVGASVTNPQNIGLLESITVVVLVVTLFKNIVIMTILKNLLHIW